LEVSYSNAGSSTVQLSVEVNQAAKGVLSLEPTKGKYRKAKVEVGLAAGKNYVSLRGGPSDGSNVRIETLTIPS
jgi:hypothetical protein